MTLGWNLIGSNFCENVCFSGKVRPRIVQGGSRRIPNLLLCCLCTGLAWHTRLCIGTRCNADWSAVDPMEYLTPFIEVIRSPEISGPITGVALTAVSRFLDAYIIGEQQMMPLSC